VERPFVDGRNDFSSDHVAFPLQLDHFSDLIPVALFQTVLHVLTGRAKQPDVPSDAFDDNLLFLALGE
jgi:hypothetical protein